MGHPDPIAFTIFGIDIRWYGILIAFGMMTAVLISCKRAPRHGITDDDVLDLFIPSVALAQAIGRWGNFFNGEAHGGPTDLPWGILVDGVKVHPTFLYESIWCVILFIALSYYDRHIRTANGQTFSLYLIFYSLERFFVEALRTDSLMIGPFKQAQVISLCAMAAGIMLYIYSTKHLPLNEENK